MDILVFVLLDTVFQTVVTPRYLSSNTWSGLSPSMAIQCRLRRVELHSRNTCLNLRTVITLVLFYDNSSNVICQIGRMRQDIFR